MATLCNFLSYIGLYPYRVNFIAGMYLTDGLPVLSFSSKDQALQMPLPPLLALPWKMSEQGISVPPVESC